MYLLPETNPNVKGKQGMQAGKLGFENWILSFEVFIAKKAIRDKQQGTDIFQLFKMKEKNFVNHINSDFLGILGFVIYSRIK